MKRENLKNTNPTYKPTKYELVLASTMFLMTRYVRRADIHVARAIEEHLDRLANHVEQNSDFINHTSCSRLRAQWLDIRTNFYDSRGLGLSHNRSLTNTLIN